MNVLNEKRLKDYKELQTLHTNEDHHCKRYSDSFSCASVSSLGTTTTTTTTAGRSLQTNISSCLPQTLFGLPRVQATGRGGRGGREAKNEWGVFE